MRQRACHLRRIQVTRMMFNESGQVQAIASLSEDRFVLEQMGYTVSR